LQSSTRYIRAEEAREEDGKFYEISTGKPLGKQFFKPFFSFSEKKR
jgi:hypothetical protein